MSPASRPSRPAASGNALLFVLALSMAFGFLLTFLLQQGQVQAKSSRFELSSVRALYDAYAELEKAKAILAAAEYDSFGHNVAIQEALARADNKLPGTDVVVQEATGAEGTWYSMVVHVPYEDHYERVVQQMVREIDYFSSYLLFVSEHPAGVSGQPVGPIHSNKSVQFYFPNGEYQSSVTAVEGFEYKAGAASDNTTLSGPSNEAVDRIDLDLESDDRININVVETNAEPSFSFPEENDVALRFYVKEGKQRVVVETWSQPAIEHYTVDVVVGYNAINPREVEYSYWKRESRGLVTKTRDVQVFDHYETVKDEKQVPVYVEDTRIVQKPVYVDEERTREVPVYVDEERTRTVVKTVWVPLDDGTGGTAVGGDGGANLGYWAEKEVEETYTVKVIDHYETQTYTVKVIDHYDDVEETYKRLDHYDTVYVDRQVKIYRTETEEYEVEAYEWVKKSATYTAYDYEPVYQTQPRTRYVSSKRLTSNDLPAPDNGLIYAAGDVRSIQGEVIDRMTVASRGDVLVTGDIVYKDVEGDNAYLNGKTPWLPYEPNPSYDNSATLGLIAYQDVVYTRAVPDNLEVNASMLAITGRVGIEGVVLDEEGEITAYNKFTDEFGRAVGGSFRKNSIRRLGGVTTALRPVETVVDNGSITSGFNTGQGVFDVSLLAGPPPFFLSYPKPRFFALQILQ